MRNPHLNETHLDGLHDVDKQVEEIERRTKRRNYVGQHCQGQQPTERAINVHGANRNDLNATLDHQRCGEEGGTVRARRRHLNKETTAREAFCLYGGKHSKIFFLCVSLRLVKTAEATADGVKEV